MDLALVTCKTLPEPDPDAAPLADALARVGVSAAVRAWDDPDVDWSQAALTVFRSSWNYPRHLAGFLAWAEAAAAVSQLWNPLDIVRWNSHKSYLLDLERRGVAIAPTVLVPRGDARPLADIAGQRGWDRVVVKPAVSAASFRTRQFGAGDPAGEAHLRGLAAERDVLVQRYLPSVEGPGERALMWIDGEITHAVRKAPRFEGEAEAVSVQAVVVAPEEEALARQAVAVVSSPLLYARVDMASGPDGHPVIMELELIEPSLFFTQCPPALDRFVAAIERLLGEPGRIRPAR